MTEKRFEVYKVIGSFCEWCIEDNVDGKFVTGSIMHKYGADRLCDKLNALNDENEQLKERNNRQAKRLAELYELMAKKDWESLTEIIDDFCSCEERLQQEWKCYE